MDKQNSKTNSDVNSRSENSAERVSKGGVEVPLEKPVNGIDSSLKSSEERRENVFKVDEHLRDLEEGQKESFADKLLSFFGIEKGEDSGQDDEEVGGETGGLKNSEKKLRGAGEKNSGGKEKGNESEESKEKKGLWAAITGGFSVAGSWVSAKLGAAKDSVKKEGGVWNWFKKKMSWRGAKEKGNKVRGEGDDVKDFVLNQIEEAGNQAFDGFTYPSKMVTGAANSLKKALSEHADWKGFAAKAASQYGVPVSVIFAIINFESAFKASIKNSGSAATGLGQFMPRTWDGIQGYLPNRLKGKSRKDAEASIFATAAYCLDNAKACGIDLNAADAASRLYEAHHEGAAGYRRLQAFREKGVRFKVPTTYRNKNFKYFGVKIAGKDDCENYSILIGRMAGRIQVVSDHYGKMIVGLENPSNDIA